MRVMLANILSHNTIRRVAILVILLLGGLLGWRLLDTSVWWLSILALPTACVISYFLLAKPDKETLIEHGIMMIATPITILLIQAIILWFVVNFIWASADETPVSVPYTLAPAGDEDPAISMTVTHPQTVLFDEPRNRIDLRLSADDGELTSPLTVTLTLDDSLRFVATGSAQPAGQVVFEIGESDTQQTLYLAHATVPDGFRPTTTITVTAASTVYTLNSPESIPINVEGQQGFAVRQFVNSTVNQGSPVLLLLTVLVPGVGALLQSRLSQARSELQEQRRQEFNQLWQEFQEKFLAEDKEAANKLLSEMRKSKFKAFEASEIRTAQVLIDFANFYDLRSEKCPEPQPPGDSTTIRNTTRRWREDRAAAFNMTVEGGKGRRDNNNRPKDDDNNKKSILKITHRWPEGWAVAYIMAVEESKAYGRNDCPKDKEYDASMELLHKARVLIPRLDLAHDQILQDRLAALEHDKDSIRPPLQKRLWPLPIAQLPRENHDTRAAFAADDASLAHDLKILANGGFIGSLHPAFRRLAGSNGTSFLITGPPGSGRTTLARRLPIVDDFPPLAVNVKAEAGWQEIATDVAELLLRFIGEHPTWIGRLASDELEDLARHLVNYLGSGIVLSELTRKQNNADRIHDLEDEAELQTLAREQIQLLKRRVRDVADRGTITAGIARNLAPYTNRDFLHCVEVLGFDGLLLVCDTGVEHARWLNNFIMRDFEAWPASNFRFAVFVPKEVEYIAESFVGLPGIELMELQWTEEELSELIRYRLKSVSTEPIIKPYEHYFDDVGVGQFMIEQSKCNPRQLIRLWRTVLEAKGDELATTYITWDDVHHAVERLGS